MWQSVSSPNSLSEPSIPESQITFFNPKYLHKIFVASLSVISGLRLELSIDVLVTSKSPAPLTSCPPSWTKGGLKIGNEYSFAIIEATFASIS